MRTQLFVESVELLEADKETRTVKQKIITVGESKNKRHYPETVLKGAVSLFEGAKTYADHPSRNDMRNRPERSITDITGWLSDVHFDEASKAIVGTRHFTTNQKGQDAWQLAQQVVFENAPPSLFGASINALGRGEKRDDGMMEVAEITSVVSVDDVTTPAAGGGFDKLIASDGGDIVSAVMESADYEEWLESRPDYVERLRKEMKLARQTSAVKTAKAEADRAKEALKEAEDKRRAVLKEHEATLTELDKARRELIVVETLQKVRLPAEWKADLRPRLVESEPDEWAGIIQAEEQKAKRGQRQTVDNLPKRRVQESYKPDPVAKASDSKPRADEDFNAWQSRISKLKR